MIKNKIQTLKDKITGFKMKVRNWMYEVNCKLDRMFAKVRKVMRIVIIPVNILMLLFGGLTPLFEYGTTWYRVFDYATIACLIGSVIIGILAGSYKLFHLMGRTLLEFFSNILIFLVGLFSLFTLNIFGIVPALIGGFKGMLWGVAMIAVWSLFFICPAGVAWYYAWRGNKYYETRGDLKSEPLDLGLQQ